MKKGAEFTLDAPFFWEFNPLFTTKIIKLITMQKKLFTAIIFFDASTGRQPAKYRNISNPASFVRFAKNSGAIYCNWYSKETREFTGRQNFTE
jgi:hypothetical protein